METFPTMGNWLAGSHQDTRKGDPTQRSRFYSGYSQRTNRFTWVPRLFQRRLVNLTTANVDTLNVFETTVKYGQSAFNWTDVMSSTVYQVAFDEETCPLKFKLFGGTNDKWAVDLSFVQTTPAELSTSHTKDGKMQYQVEDLAAGVDIASRPIFSSSYAYSFSKASLLLEGATAGIDDSNTCVVTLKNGAGTTIVTKTYNTSNQPIDSDYNDLGTLSVTSIIAGDIITLTVTQGVTSNMPAFSVILE